MSIYYCSLHTRPLSGQYKEWIDSSLEQIKIIKGLYKISHSANIETSEYKIIETSCGQCKESTCKPPYVTPLHPEAYGSIAWRCGRAGVARLPPISVAPATYS